MLQKSKTAAGGIGDVIGGVSAALKGKGIDFGDWAKSKGINYIENELSEAQKLEMMNRNNQWLEKILSATQEDIICVGYMYLFEEYGLLKKMHDMGYSVEQMNQEGNFVTIDNSEFYLKQPKKTDWINFTNKFLQESYGEGYADQFLTYISSFTDSVVKATYDFISNIEKDAVDHITITGDTTYNT